jgi:hypothetical protein
MRRGTAAALAVAALVAGLAACEPAATHSTVQPGATSSIGGGITFEPPASFGPPASPSPDPASPVVLDPTLLEILPESIEGTPVTEALDEAAFALTDPALPRIASALDVGVAIDTATADLVTAHVVKLRPEAFTEANYRQWRDSFDEGACAGAGGVGGVAQALIDERTVHIGSCASGQLTYHLWLTEHDILISAASIGDGRFGEKLMDNLRVPAPPP